MVPFHTTKKLMFITEEQADRVSGYYCEVRALEDELDSQMDLDNTDGYTSHPDWDDLSDKITDKWNLSQKEQEVLDFVLDQGLCDYFCAEDVLALST
jgi:hypothetical protein